jgi:hypothetical protein
LKPAVSLIEVNIKDGMPFADQAISRFNIYLNDAVKMKYRVLKVVHGYGSTGKGGRIRTELLKHLESLKSSGRIKLFVPGDKWDIFDADAREIINTCRELSSDSDLGSFNKGITIILIK